MGTTLTGTTPQDTYDSLIKVTDNGPLSGTLKKLTDGLGNDSSLSLSTTAASLSGTLAVSGATTLAAATVTSVSARNSGVPALQGFRDLDVAVVGSAGQGIELGARDGSTYKAGSAIYGTLDNPSTTGNMVFQTRTADALTTKMTITSEGNVGIGTSSPDAKLDVEGLVDYQIMAKYNATNYTEYGYFGLNVFGGGNPYVFKLQGNEIARFNSAGGISFNGDTAAANALDDYEEGTFTATLTPSTSGSISLFSTFQTLSYTKIGRQVTVKGLLLVESASSPVGTEVVIGGLPFVTLNASSGRGSGSVFVAGNSFNSATYHTQNASTISVIYDASTISGAANSDWYITFTYFV